MRTNVETSPKEALEHFFGFSSFKGEQEAIIQNVLEGNNTFVIMPTGGGKSLCYQLPALMSEGTAIIVSPLIALMKNQVDAIRGFGGEEGVAHFLNSSLSRTEAIRVKKDIKSGVTKLLYVAPESLTKKENVEFLSDIQISFFAIDEAHCISEWGHDFRPEYRRLRTIFDEIKRVPMIALTATATEKVQEDILKNLDIPGARTFKDSFNRPNLFYEVRPKVNVGKEIIKFVKQHSGRSGIIYCLSRKKVEEMAEMLSVNGIKALPYHAGMDAGQRASHQDKFLMEEVDVIVATIAFGMGIDKPDVRFVAHLDLPRTVEGYYQETGRAGRDGEPAEAWMVYGLADVVGQRRLIEDGQASEEFKRVLRGKLEAMLMLAEAHDCRRQRLLSYFGEDSEPCGNCDNCLEPPELWDGTEAARMALSCIYRMAQHGEHQGARSFGAAHLIDVLRGKPSPKVRQYGHDQLSTYGIGRHLSEALWRAVLRQLVAQGHVVTETEFPTLLLTENARAVLRGEVALTMKQPREQLKLSTRPLKPARRSGGAQGAGSRSAHDWIVEFDEAAQARYERLKTWRTAQSRAQGRAPYVIFHDSTLAEMAARQPRTADELSTISGVGAHKLEAYGADLLSLM